jgi:hypothetical protein
MFSDSRRLLAAAILLAILVGAWMFRYQPFADGRAHVNRFTGAVCGISQECWLR